MAAYAVIFFVTLGASVLTFFSGFGLGTILMPVLAFYVSIPAAIAITAIVHLFNNVFKGIVLFKHIHRKTFLLFALPALAGSLLGAWLLTHVKPNVFYSYTFNGQIHEVYIYEFLVALLVLFILAVEWIPSRYFSFSEKWLIPGGFITGFCGGFTGMQGAIRSSFLVQLNRNAAQYVATSTAISMLIDTVRIVMYAVGGVFVYAMGNEYLALAGIGGALIGVMAGKQLLKKITFGFIRIITTACIILFSLALGAGLMH